MLASRVYFQETKTILGLAVPLVVAHLIQGLSPFIGVIMLGKLGTEALAASGLVSPLFAAFTASFFSMLNAIAVLTAQAHGTQNNLQIRKIFQHGLFFGILLSVPQISLLLSAPFLLQWLSQPLEVIELANAYLRACAWLILPAACLAVLQLTLVGLGRTKVIMLLSLFIVPTEILGMYLLIFGKFGFPALGIAGIGYAIAATLTLGCLILVIYLIGHPDYRSYAFFTPLRQREPQLLSELARIGMPIGIMYGVEILALGVMGLLMSQFTSDALAAHQIAVQYIQIIVMTLFGISQAVTVRIGQAVGEGNFTNLLYIGYIGAMIVLVFTGIMAMSYWLFPTSFIALDLDIHNSKNYLLIEYAIQFLLIAGFFQIAYALRLIMVGALRGLKDTQAPMWISLFAFWGIGLPSGILLAFGLNWQGAGIWLGMTIGVIIGAIILVYRFHKIVNKTSFHLAADSVRG